jgi:hypothetical protein
VLAGVAAVPVGADLLASARAIDAVARRRSLSRARRSRALADECHADPVGVASSLTHDILKDNAEADFLLVAGHVQTSAPVSALQVAALV